MTRRSFFENTGEAIASGVAHSANPADAKRYGAEALRNGVLVPGLFFSGAGTSGGVFLRAMAGEVRTFSDMDGVPVRMLKQGGDRPARIRER